MKKRISVQLMCLILLFAVMGCSSSDNNPIAPPNSDAEINLPVSQIDETQTNRSLLGMWTMNFDLENLSVLLTPYRELEAHYNVTSMLPPLLLSINSYNLQTGIVDVDVSITSPYQIDGYDVRLIIYTDGTGHMLKNPDNWTALYDISGGLPINPFKAYAKSTPNRIFEGQTQHTENLLIYLPAGDPNVMFAIDASYPENCEEPYEISNFTHDDIYGFAGSSALAEINVYDWQGDVDSVSLYCPEILGGTIAEFFQVNPESWGLILVNETGAPSGLYTGYVFATSAFLPLYEKVQIYIKHHRPDSGWAETWGGTANDAGVKIATDNAGNIYTTGAFNGTADLDPGIDVDEHTSNGLEDIYLSKFDEHGNCIWSRTWGGIGGEKARSITTDNDGNVYVTGGYSWTVDFNPGVEVEEHTSNGGHDIFVSKFDSDGNFQWVNGWGSSLAEWGHDIVADALGNIYATGHFYLTVDFDPGLDEDIHTSKGLQDIFVSKFNSNGDFLWAITVGGVGHDAGNGIDVDTSNNIYIAGSFHDLVDFDPGSGVAMQASNGGYDAFLSKYKSDGSYSWALTWGGIYDDWSYGLKIDNSDNILVDGVFQDIVDFYPGPSEQLHQSNGEEDLFLSKFDPVGNFSWALTWGGAASENAHLASRAPAIDSSDNIYFPGTFTGVVDFDPGLEILEYISIGAYDSFLSKFDHDGNYLWTRTWGGLSTDVASAAAVDYTDKVIVTGWFSDEVDFNPGSGFDHHSSNGNGDVFLVKFLPNGYWE